MLSRAAARAAKARTPSSLTPSPFTITQRSYAKVGKPSPAPKWADSMKHKNKPAPQTATGAARQTSPGTSVPKDQTWKPKDSIKFGGPAAAAGATSAAAGAGAGAGAAEKVADASGNTAPTEQPGPVPESIPLGEPTPSTARDQESANEEFQTKQSPEANTEPTEQPSEQPPSGPLPDLRQGIPSTFDFEFGGAKKGATQTEAGRDVNVDPEEGLPTPSGRARKTDEDYDPEDYETSFDKRRATMANYMYAAIAMVFLTGSAYFARPYSDHEEPPAGLAPEDIQSWSPTSMYARVKSRMSSQMGYYTEPTFPKLLPDIPEAQRPPLTLVLSLEDLMIHSGWTREHGWRTAKRPGIDYFLRYLSQYYELVVFTSVPMTMADPVIKKLDPFRIIQWPLFREATRYEKGEYIKDLSYLNRPLDKVILIDTKAEHAKNQPENAIILPKWQGDPKDPHAKDLVALIPFLEYCATMGIQDIRTVLESFKGKDIPTEFAVRESRAREEFQKQLAAEQSRKPKKSLGGLLNNALGIKAAPGGMTLDNETSVAEGLAQGKMLSDQIRERGQREYERLENEIRTNGAKWLKEMEEEEKKFMESNMKEMKGSWFGFGAPKGSEVEKRQG